RAPVLLKFKEDFVSARNHDRERIWRNLRALLKCGFLCVLRSSGLLALAKRWVRSNGAVVLTFHRVLSECAAAQTLSPAALVVTETSFESLLSYMKENYSIVDLPNGRPAGATDRIRFAITFDDGWEDNASTAFPIAARLNAPFTIFVCPELMDRYLPFWPE